MDVLLLHDPREHPLDLFSALAAAGHRVASHGGDADALPDFLAAMRWRPQALVVDFRGRPARALDVARRAAASAPGAHLVLVHGPASARDEAARDLPAAARDAEDATGVLEALARLARSAP